MTNNTINFAELSDGFSYVDEESYNPDPKKIESEQWLGKGENLSQEEISFAEQLYNVKIKDLLWSEFKGELLKYNIAGIEQDIRLMHPEFSFRPDLWSLNIIQGLYNGIDKGILASGKDSSWLEVGSGGGINEIALLLKQGLQPGQISISDSDCRQVPLSMHNVAKNCGVDALQRLGMLQSGDLLANFPMNHEKFDVAFACIPQVPLRREFDKTNEEESNYFNPDNYKSYYEGDDETLTHLSYRGLVLNDVLLQQARNSLKPNGHIVLNLAGRATEDELMKMFQRRGFNPEILHQDIIQQHPYTSIENFATIEGAIPHDFNFYSDERGENQINARTAHDLMLKKEAVYHKIYVMCAQNNLSKNA